MKRALLIGSQPCADLGCCYPSEPPYDCVVIGSLSLGELLAFRQEGALSALAEGKPVLLYTPGLPQGGKSRGLSAECAGMCRKLKSWGVVFTDGAQRRLITAQEAREMAAQNRRPGPGAVLTPLAKEILEGKS